MNVAEHLYSGLNGREKKACVCGKVKTQNISSVYADEGVKLTRLRQQIIRTSALKNQRKGFGVACSP